MHSEHFITNSGEKSLAKILNGILPKTKTLDFLVGYFYFSGIKEIKTHIENKKMRILVGLEMEKDLQNATATFDFHLKKIQSSKQKIREDYYQNFNYLFNETELFENEEEQELFKIYFHKIKNGTLEIRKTKEPCHAKMYIFSNEDTLEGLDLGYVITGSSNLTYKGLRGQNEINVRFKDNRDYVEATQIFETLWKEATVIADKDHIEEFEEGVIKNIWYEKMPAPYLMYLRCLYEYFHLDTSKRISSPHSITNGKFFNLKYQEHAVRQAMDTIDKHNGVIISDVVGLGKSIIGSAVAHNLKLKTIVIAPPHLVPQWKDYMNEFRVSYSEVFSRGVIEKALEYSKEKSEEKEKWLIIIDEAHNYRNEYTQDYGMLHELCQGNKVMLLTATPFNNQPSDIYAMLKLFQIPTKSTLHTVNNLGGAFRELIGKYKTLKKDQKEKNITAAEVKKEVEVIAKNIRNIIQPLVIRRSRLDLDKITAYKEDLKKQNIEFPIVEPPELLDYELGALSDLYVSTLQRISPKEVDNSIHIDNENETAPEQLPAHSFKATRYQPVLYEKPEFADAVRKEVEDAGFEYHLFRGAQRNLAAFMRVLLVRRFESSQFAFRISLENMLSHCENIKNWAAKRQTIPIYKKGFLPDIQEIYDANFDTLFFDEEINKEIERFQNKGLFELKTKYLREDFFTDLDADIEILKTLKKEWENLNNDPKTEEFIKILKGKLKEDPTRKIVVFSQFADTVDYLNEKLLNAKLSVFGYTSKQASETNKNVIRENFDAGMDTKRQKNDYQILVATDAISEGYNLHRAGTVFNYDIPYNPTRVIQRVGRINRINKKMFDKLFIYNYFPTAIGETETRIKEIATLKMDMIHAIMGEDTKILTKEEQLQSFFAEQYKKLIENEEKISWDTEFREEYNSLVATKDMKAALAIHHRSKIRRRTSLPQEGVLVVAKKKNDLVFLLAEESKEPQEIGAETGLKMLKTNTKENPFPVSKQFEDKYNAVKKMLYADENKGENEKQKRDAIDKIVVMMKEKACAVSYLEDLKTAIEFDAVSGYTLRTINRMKPKEYSALPDKVSNDYIQKVLQTYDAVNQGAKTLILAEEIESDAVAVDAGKLF